MNGPHSGTDSDANVRVDATAGANAPRRLEGRDGRTAAKPLDAWEADLRVEVLEEFHEASHLGSRFHEVCSASFVCAYRDRRRKKYKEKERQEKEEVSLRRPGKRLALAVKNFFTTPQPGPPVYAAYRKVYGLAGEEVAEARPTCGRCGRECASAGAARYCCPETPKTPEAVDAAARRQTTLPQAKLWTRGRIEAWPSSPSARPSGSCPPTSDVDSPRSTRDVVDRRRGGRGGR